MKNAKKIKSNIFITSSFILLLLLFYWGWLFHVTKSATPYNTYQNQETVYEVEIQLASHRGNDKLYIFTQSGRYMLDTGWKNKDKTYELSEYILSANESVTVTVWEHFPKWIFDLDNASFNVRQVVDLRNDNDIYWNIEVHNSYQQRERIFGIIAGFAISIIIVFFIFVIWQGSTRSKKRQGTKKDRGRFCVFS